MSDPNSAPNPENNQPTRSRRFLGKISLGHIFTGAASGLILDLLGAPWGTTPALAIIGGVIGATTKEKSHPPPPASPPEH